MLIADVEQGSRAWEEARFGIPTASQASRIITPTGKLSAQRRDYMAELVCEYVLREPFSDFSSPDTERGQALEPDAIAYFSMQTDLRTRKCGFVFRDAARMAGCSPDALVGDDALLEIKVPRAPTHMKWLILGEVPRQHVIQLQYSLWVTGLSKAYFCSYHPQLPELLEVVKPDALYQDAFDEHMPVFIAELIAARKRVSNMGAMLEEELTFMDLGQGGWSIRGIDANDWCITPVWPASVGQIEAGLNIAASDEFRAKLLERIDG